MMGWKMYLLEKKHGYFGVAMLDFRGVIPTFLFFRMGLEPEKSYSIEGSRDSILWVSLRKIQPEMFTCKCELAMKTYSL